MTRSPEHSASALTFEILAEVAHGETARVDLCKIKEPSPKAGTLVAVKRLHRHIAEDPAFSDMFFDEVWMTAALHHPNVVEVAGFGTDAEGTYLAVELVEGVSLARLMKTVFETGEMFSERMVVFLGTELCAGLKAAHELRGRNGEHLSLVHRDLAPGNVLVGFQGQIKIADFGLAKAKQRVTKTLTGLLKGNPQYMAPEMTLGGDIDQRADLFSLGVLLFELFTGQHPWSGSSELEIMKLVLAEPPLDILSLRPRLDRELAALVNKALSKEPRDRFQSADEIGARLWNWLSTHGYKEGNAEALGRFVRRNAMRQMRWFERAIAGELRPAPVEKPAAPARGPRAPGEPARLRRNRKQVPEEATEVNDTTPLPDEIEDEISETASSLEVEIPTLVKRADSKQNGALPGFDLIDEDSDNRPTAVKKKGAPLLLRAPSARGPASPETESEEIPTVPIRGPKKDALQKALAQAPHRPPKPVGQSSPPPPPVRSSSAPAALASHDERSLVALSDRLAVFANDMRALATRASELAHTREEIAARAEESARLVVEATVALRGGAHGRVDAMVAEATMLEDAARRAASKLSIEDSAPRSAPPISPELLGRAVAEPRTIPMQASGQLPAGVAVQPAHGQAGHRDARPAVATPLPTSQHPQAHTQQVHPSHAPQAHGHAMMGQQHAPHGQRPPSGNGFASQVPQPPPSIPIPLVASHPPHAAPPPAPSTHGPVFAGAAASPSPSLPPPNLSQGAGYDFQAPHDARLSLPDDLPLGKSKWQDLLDKQMFGFPAPVAVLVVLAFVMSLLFVIVVASC